MRAACGRAKSDAWSGSSCRCRRWSTSTSSRKTCRNSPGRRNRCTASTSRASSTCGRNAAECCSAPTSAPGVPWSPLVTPWDFGQDLLPSDLERIAPSLEVAFSHFPRLAEVGVRRVINGPFTFAPDGNPLVGPDQGAAKLLGRLRGHGRILPGRRRRAVARQLDDRGRSGRRHLGDGRGAVRRLGDAARTPMPRCAKTIRAASSIRFPNEELPAARPLRTTPIYERLQAENAVFGDYCGLEHALWFAPRGSEAREQVTFRRSNAHAHVAAECRAVRDGVGMIEISNYGKFEVTGTGAADWLARVMANRVPRRRAPGIDADAQRARPADRRFHDLPSRRRPHVPGRHLRGRELLPALVRAHAARCRRHGAAVRDGIRRPVGGRVRQAARCCKRSSTRTCRTRHFHS